ncbi:hypothetical protein VNO78_33300 [Psophocarpus tetragonolobus]|uniref:MSP domain-containing protein n=1 Tax=Psophocarpus tetragonolobus TaxID=3891 RepID=A0AAN9RPL2_PSOTE
MDRLIRLDPSNTILIRVEAGQKCHGKITLHNVMYTMPVAFRLQPLIKARYSVKPQTGIISPLATLTIDITYHMHAPQQQGSSLSTNYLPHSFPHSNDSFLLHSVLVPGANIKEPSFMFDAVPSDWFKKKQVFIDSSIKVMFAGSHIVAQLVRVAEMDNVREVLEKSDPSWGLVNSRDPHGEPLLHIAISQKRPDMVQLLLEFDPDIEALNRFGWTPLEAAAARNEALIVELLLARGASTERPELIHHVAREGHVEVLRLLLAKGARVDLETKDGNTALHVAVEEGRKDCFKVLLANAARTDAKNAKEGDTPLHMASAMGDESMVKLILEKCEATKHVRNAEGKSPYDVAVENGHACLYDMLCLGDKLCMAARKGKMRTIQKVLEKGAAINGRDQYAWTPLHRAAFKGRIDAVKLLLERGAEVDAADGEGYTPLHCAVEAGHADVTEILVKKGADVGARTKRGVRALAMAEALSYVGIVRVLNGGEQNGVKLGFGGVVKKMGGGKIRVLNSVNVNRDRYMALSVI